MKKQQQTRWTIKNKVKSLAELRVHNNKTPNVNVPAMKYFNRLAIYAQRENDLDVSLGQHALMPIPLSLFAEKDQLMHESNKSTFVKNTGTSLIENKYREGKLKRTTV